MLTTPHRTGTLLSALCTAFLFAACTSAPSTADETNTSAIPENTPQPSGEALQPEAVVLPDVVARVNGEDVTGQEYEAFLGQAQQMAMMQGLDPADPETQEQIRADVFDQLIGTKLLRQRATEEGPTVSDAAVEEEYQVIVQQIGGTGALAEQLTLAGMTEEGLREDIRSQLGMQQYMEEYVATKSITLTEEEMRALYDEVSSEQQDIPPYEDVQEQIRMQLTQEREQALITDLVEELRANADVEILLEE